MLVLIFVLLLFLVIFFFIISNNSIIIIISYLLCYYVFFYLKLIVIWIVFDKIFDLFYCFLKVDVIVNSSNCCFEFKKGCVFKVLLDVVGDVI